MSAQHTPGPLAYVQYIAASDGEWHATERMSRSEAETLANSMLPEQQAFVRVCAIAKATGQEGGAA